MIWQHPYVDTIQALVSRLVQGCLLTPVSKCSPSRLYLLGALPFEVLICGHGLCGNVACGYPEAQVCGMNPNETGYVFSCYPGLLFLDVSMHN